MELKMNEKGAAELQAFLNTVNASEKVGICEYRGAYQNLVRILTANLKPIELPKAAMKTVNSKKKK